MSPSSVSPGMVSASVGESNIAARTPSTILGLGMGNDRDAEGRAALGDTWDAEDCAEDGAALGDTWDAEVAGPELGDAWDVTRRGSEDGAAVGETWDAGGAEDGAAEEGPAMESKMYSGKKPC